MPEKKAPRNKTIDTPVSEGAAYLSRCVRIDRQVDGIDSVTDKTVIGDMRRICPLLPKESVDLIIADPPYNLTKIYNGSRFGKKKAADYEEYTREWLSVICPLLRPEGSVYVCCDWETNLITGRVLGDFFRIRSRITWQREKGRGAGANWKNGLEDIWFATKTDRYTFNLDAVKMRRRVIAPYRVDGKPKDWISTDKGSFRDTCPSNFWDDITIPFWSMPENTAHPAQKPEKLIPGSCLPARIPGILCLIPSLGQALPALWQKSSGVITWGSSGRSSTASGRSSALKWRKRLRVSRDMRTGCSGKETACIKTF